MKITIPAMKNGCLDPEYGIRTSDGDNIKCGIPQKSFEIKWDELPEEAKSIAIIYMDYDNAQYEGVPWVHWLAADIPAEWGGLKENQAADGEGFVQGHNSWSIPYAPYDTIEEKYTIGFGGPAPDVTHEYELEICALDDYLGLEEGFFFNQLRHGIEEHLIDKTIVRMLYTI